MKPLADSRLMGPSSSSNPPISRVSSSSKDGKPSLRKRLSSAIRDKSCPICLRHIHRRSAAVLSVCMHVYCADCIRKWSQLKRKCPLCNSHFHSWFLRGSTTQFHEEKLQNLDSISKTSEIDGFRRATRWLRSIEQSVNRQPMGLPWRRSFGGSRFIPYDPHTVLRWRASIYSQRLRAVPLPSNNCLEQMILTNTSAKERIKQRIEPWITRELQAILQDPDPSVIVHFATFLYMSSLEEKLRSSSECPAAEDTFVEQLRPFLHDQTNMFWHELRCYAGCSFDMETYDSVVEYRHL